MHVLKLKETRRHEEG